MGDDDVAICYRLQKNDLVTKKDFPRNDLEAYPYTWENCCSAGDCSTYAVCDASDGSLTNDYLKQEYTLTLLKLGSVRWNMSMHLDECTEVGINETENPFIIFYK
jgi:hypothetical protein